MTANPNLSRIIADGIQRMCEETPDPFDRWNFPGLFGPNRNYREMLDHQPRNCYGELIPRIVTVRRNIARAKGYKPTW